MQIKQERLKERIERINEMSRDETGGYTRLAFGEKETKARMMAKEMMLEAGLEVEIDAAGNLMGRLYPDNWNEKELHGVIATGSHIDTVRNGGKFDGLLGSIAGIEVAQCLKENHVKLKSPFEVILFTDEEGARLPVLEWNDRLVNIQTMRASVKRRQCKSADIIRKNWKRQRTQINMKNLLNFILNRELCWNRKAGR